MILAAGLTPTWQQIYVLDRLRAGDVNRAVQVARCPSGKVLNVGIALAVLKKPSVCLSLVGRDDRGAMDRELSALRVKMQWIESAARTRTCTSILDRAAGVTTELVENAGAVSAEELERFRAAFAEEAAGAKFVVLTGSLPRGTPASFYRELLESVRCPALLDVRGDELLLALARRPLIVKPNREELAATVGRALETEKDLHAAMAEINERGAQWVVVSAGKEAVWVRGDGQLVRLEPPKLERVVNPIGCGDVLAAGIAAGLVEGREPIEAVRFGIAAAAESALDLLPARFDVRRLAARMVR